MYPSEVPIERYRDEALKSKNVKDLSRRLDVEYRAMHNYLKRNGYLDELANLTEDGPRRRSRVASRPPNARAAQQGNFPHSDKNVHTKSKPVQDSQQIIRISNKTGETLESKGTRIRTLEDLLKAAEVDLTVWQVASYTVNKWEQHSVKAGVVELFQVKARLERIEQALNLTVLRDAVVDAMREHSPAPVRRYKFTPKTGLMMEVMIPDLHLGALSHAEETGASYDGRLAVAAFRHVFYGLLTHAQNMKVGRIVFPVGNDLLHVDTERDETTNGTRQDTDSRPYRSIRRAVDLMVEAVDAMAQIAPVDIVITPGNHARAVEGMLGEVLRAWYRNEDRITLHDSPAPRKYIRHGTNLIGYAHGDKGSGKDLPLIMATEAPEDWAKTKHRTFALGHLHQRKRDIYGAVEENRGVEVRISPSLKATDSWHSGQGLIGNLRAAEGRVFSDTSGEIARFTATLPEDYEATA